MVAAALLLVGACGGDDDDDSSATTTSDAATATTSATATSESTSTTLDDQGQVLAAYRAANDAFNVAADPPNPDHPDLLVTRTGDSLARTQDNLRQLLAQGVGGRVTYDSSPTDVQIVGDQATLVDCFVDHTQLYQLSTGAPVGDPGETVLHLDVTMQRVDGAWMLADSTRRADPCEAA